MKAAQTEWAIERGGHRHDTMHGRDNVTVMGVACYFKSHTGVVHYGTADIHESFRHGGYAAGYTGCGRKFTGGIVDAKTASRMTLCPKCFPDGAPEWTDTETTWHTGHNHAE